MKELLERMNVVLSDWKAQFDVMAGVQMEFYLNSEDKLYLNELPVHVPEDLSLASAEFTAENVKFYFEGSQNVLVIGILWPEDEVPTVGTIRFGYEGV